jgi:hypothetical protein
MGVQPAAGGGTHEQAKDWAVLYTPMAVPLASAGAIFEISEGRVASRMLKAMKYRPSHTTICQKLSSASAMPSWAAVMMAMAPMNTCFSLAFSRHR